MLESLVYKVGERVSISGRYVCVPCGYKRTFRVGDVFTSCLNCMRISKPVSDAEFEEAAARGEEIDEFDRDAVAANMELWELVTPD